MNHTLEANYVQTMSILMMIWCELKLKSRHPLHVVIFFVDWNRKSCEWCDSMHTILYRHSHYTKINHITNTKHANQTNVKPQRYRSFCFFLSLSFSMRTEDLKLCYQVTTSFLVYVCEQTKRCYGLRPNGIWQHTASGSYRLYVLIAHTQKHIRKTKLVVCYSFPFICVYFFSIRFAQLLRNMR